MARPRIRQMQYEKRFQRFVSELETISNRYGIAVTVTGGVDDVPETAVVKYQRDHTSGDILLTEDSARMILN